MGYHDWSRRNFLKTAGVATLGALGAGYPRIASGATPPPITPTADRLIILWMAGGMAHTETFDPKKYTAYETGLASDRVLSTFKPIDSVVDNIKLSEGLENVASVMDRATLMRTYQSGDLGHILHSRHQFQWHTGYAPPLTVAAPHIGAVISRTLGPLNPDVPAFIDIGQRLTVGEGEELKAFHTAGFLGTEYGPFFIPDPAEAQRSVSPPEGMTNDRFTNRHKLYQDLINASPVGELGSDYQQDSMVRAMESAYRLLKSPASKAFDLSQEPQPVYDRYNTGRFGLGCLLARRLCEEGARFIEVTTEYEPFVYWDTHEDGHERLVGMKETIDAPIAQLVLDLEERGLLDRTLIVLASEFSRDMITEGKPDKPVSDQVEVPDVMTETKHYGMHRHFTDACPVLMFGGGMKQGYLYGETADERPCKSIDKPFGISELHATIYRAMGIPADLAYEVEQRPFYTTKDGLGEPIMDVFA